MKQESKVLEMNNRMYFMFSKLAWFNKLNEAGVYKVPLLGKEDQNDLIQEFLKRYDRHYIHKNHSYIGSATPKVQGLGEVLSEPINRIKSWNFTDILVRGYSHDFRIIIYLLLSIGFTLWFHSHPVHIPQIELCREIVQQPYVYTITHSILSSSQHLRIEPTKCILKKIPSILTPATDFYFDTSTTIVKYIKHNYYPGWSELKHIRPEELGKCRLLNEKIIELLGFLALRVSIVFDPLDIVPLDIVEKSAEDVGKLMEDFNDTAKGRLAKRGKCQLISIVVVILLMSLVESTPASIPS